MACRDPGPGSNSHKERSSANSLKESRRPQARMVAPHTFLLAGETLSGEPSHARPRLRTHRPVS